MLEEYALARASEDMQKLLHKVRTSRTVVRVLSPSRRLVRAAAENNNNINNTDDDDNNKDDDDDETEVVSVDVVQCGDVVVLAEGETVPVDGIVVAPAAQNAAARSDGSAIPTVDSSTITGEFAKQRCPPGVPVFSGSTVLPGPRLRLCASKPAKESVLALLKQELAMALGRKRQSKLEMKAEAAATAVFTPCALFLAAAAFFYRRGKPGAWEAVLGVLMGASPCPLVIGVPIAFLSGTSVAARRGITLKSSQALEQLASCSTAVLDKTGAY